MLQETLARYGQSHVLQFEQQLSAAERQELQNQVEQIDFAQLQRLTSRQDQGQDWGQLARRAEPPPAVRLDRQHPEFSSGQALAAGKAALAAGRVGVILVAGGQGTRLGFEQPKGMFPIGPLSNRTLFQMHCDRQLAVMKRYDVSIPLFVMTSPATDEETRRFFADHDRCGLSEEQLVIFCQGTMPAVDEQTGKVLLSSPSSLALSPDGHGGLVTALDRAGCLKQAKQRGIDLFYYAQVDNPLAELCDPELLGYHLLARSQMTTQVVKKRFASEKVGNVVMVDGKVQIIEYSDLPAESAEQVDGQGELKLWAGNIAVHVFDREFLEAVVASAEGLPFHRARKPVPYVDAQGNHIEPQQPNAIKFERFVFDLLPLAERAFVVEGDAAQVFAPVKNANGSPVDTPVHTQAALLALHRRWLEDAGAKIAPQVRVEIHPDWALDAEEVHRKLAPQTVFHADTYLR
ncbi:MAG: UTP--glucose-1-phosphate uridylyltransferase [Planctomycetales bacterium]|nr:UTP--glucose-1-phosphate uridylyltransferase [Planctomycetales bacterium]